MTRAAYLIASAIENAAAAADTAYSSDGNEPEMTTSQLQEIAQAIKAATTPNQREHLTNLLSMATN
jgi:hypothetical protein